MRFHNSHELGSELQRGRKGNRRRKQCADEARNVIRVLQTRAEKREKCRAIHRHSVPVIETHDGEGWGGVVETFDLQGHCAAKRATLVTDDVAGLAQKLKQENANLVSSGVVIIPRDEIGFSKGAMVADPDGHNVLLIQK